MSEMDARSFRSACLSKDFDAAVRILSSERFNPQWLSLKDEDGCTPLLLACRSGNVQLVKIIIEKYHRDPESKGGRRKTTPLHEACRYKFPVILQI